jgi:hypothetical protein
MTQALSAAVATAALLPEEEQDVLAAILLEEMWNRKSAEAHSLQTLRICWSGWPTKPFKMFRLGGLIPSTSCSDLGYDRSVQELWIKAPIERSWQIRRAYQLWRDHPSHPSLRFKKVHANLPINSAHVDLDWRAVGVLKDSTFIWFWVGSHKAYESLLRSL